MTFKFSFTKAAPSLLAFAHLNAGSIWAAENQRGVVCRYDSIIAARSLLAFAHLDAVQGGQLKISMVCVQV